MKRSIFANVAVAVALGLGQIDAFGAQRIAAPTPKVRMIDGKPEPRRARIRRQRIEAIPAPNWWPAAGLTRKLLRAKKLGRVHAWHP